MKIQTNIPQWSGRKWRWTIGLFLLLMAVFLVAMVWLPWQARRIEGNQIQARLIADTTLVEQSILFQLSRNEDQVRQAGWSITHQRLSREQAIERFRQLLKTNYEIHRIDWYDEHDKIIGSTLESRSTPPPIGTRRVAPDGKILCDKPGLEADSPNIYLLSCTIPLQNDGHRDGSIVLSYRLQGILEAMVPWWFAQSHEIAILAADGKVLAERAAGGSGTHVYTHDGVLDLPGLALTLHTNSLQGKPPLLSNLLVLAIMLLSLGLLWSVIALWRDISRRLSAESALRQQVAFRTAMENSLTTGMRARDMDGRLTYVNPAFCKMVGYPAAQMVGCMPPMPYWIPEAFEQYQTRFASVLDGSACENGFEMVFQRANGERFPVMIYESPLINEDGTQSGWMSSVLDISDIRQAELRLRQQQDKVDASARLATIGEIGSTLAHELNQPLTAISSYASGALNLIAADNQPGQAKLALLQGALQKVVVQVQRANQIHRSVHAFVKKSVAAHAPVALPHLIKTILPLVELQAKALHVHVQCQVEEDLPTVMADKALLEQVLLNLTRNAIEAMACCPQQQRILRIHASLEAAADHHAPTLLAVEVIDQGHGIPEAIAAQLFAPFFSTKADGMGMGLNICRSAIEFHGGSLCHRNNPGGGTIFRFALPLARH